MIRSVFRPASGAEAIWSQHTTTCGPLAQLAEQQTLNLRVWGSSPRRLTIFYSTIRDFRLLTKTH